jgi:hypothetical protein
MGYRIVETALPFEGYTSRVSVRPLDADRCNVTWSSVLTPRETDSDDSSIDVESFLHRKLASGIEGLRRLHER